MLTNPQKIVHDELELPGVILQAARERAGLSQSEVADKLRLLPRQVAALESGDYQHFNAEIFCRGYLRSYAKLLKIDEQMLLDRYLQQRPKQKDENQFRPSPAVQIQRPGKGHNIQYWCLAAFVVVVVALWMLADNEKVTEYADLNPAETKVIVDNNDPSLMQHDESVVDTADVVPTFELLVSPASLPDVQGETPVVDSATRRLDDSIEKNLLLNRTSTPTSVDKEQNVGTEPVSQGLLHFQFADDCWVEVRDRDDKIIFADLKRARDTLTLSGNAPFKIHLGYAPGVSLDYNGEPVSITVDQEYKSARLVVGQL
jgi:cytoskeleton protein RodZ